MFLIRLESKKKNIETRYLRVKHTSFKKRKSYNFRKGKLKKYPRFLDPGKQISRQFEES